MASRQHKELITDTIEDTFDRAHRLADTLTFPLGPLDAVVHGVTRGVSNWLLDKHPKRSNTQYPTQKYRYQPSICGGNTRYNSYQPNRDDSDESDGEDEVEDTRFKAGNRKIKGQSVVRDIKGSDKSRLRAGNLKGNRRSMVGDI